MCNGKTYLLVGYSLGIIAHELLHVVYSAHFCMDLLEDLGALLQAEDDILLNLGEFDIGREFLELFKLSVCLGE